MSTRAGQFETLKDVVDEVGADAARFMFLSRKSDSRLDFDLELVKQKSMDNPVYYVQYAHARICSLNKKAAEAGKKAAQVGPESLALLDTEYDMQILKLLDQYPDCVEGAAKTQSPHVLAHICRSLHQPCTDTIPTAMSFRRMTMLPPHGSCCSTAWPVS